MIETIDIRKQFDGIKAVDGASVVINEGNVFGLIGTNGAGKSTFLRMISGILKPDSGKILIDSLEVFENPAAKQLFFYISDDQFYFSNSRPKDMKSFYKVVYPNFDGERFDHLLQLFELDDKRKINTFSKGMKKQLSIICAICANTKYIFCDETFDGLDPVMRQAVKSIFVKEIAERNMTAVIASHNLRELEDICDHIGLLHKGGVLLSKDLYDAKLSIQRAQCVFNQEEDQEAAFEGLEIIKTERRGNLITVTVRVTQEELVSRLKKVVPVYYEVLPLTLEELFISETEVVGYDIKKLIY